ncbi:MAG: hypothetical protein ABUK18_04590, partial [Candidatus Bathyarchaeia archaeon]
EATGEGAGTRGRISPSKLFLDQIELTTNSSKAEASINNEWFPLSTYYCPILQKTYRVLGAGSGQASMISW